MRNRIIAVAVLGLAICNQTFRAQQMPSAVIADPPVDKKFPPSVVGMTVTSHGVEMDTTFYLASGAGPHGTVLLLHGLPGYETNGDLAQSIRRAGLNVLLFHYRGTGGPKERSRKRRRLKIPRKRFGSCVIPRPWRSMGSIRSGSLWLGIASAVF